MKVIAKILFLPVCVMFFAGNAYAGAPWVKPYVSYTEIYDDNIYLGHKDREEDFISSVTPGITVEIPFKKHRFMTDYNCNIQYFKTYHKENNYNHTVESEVELNFNKWHVVFNNKFRYFSDRSGSEDTGRIPRNQNQTGAHLTIDFDKMDLTGGFRYLWDYYRTTRPIGSFQGKSLNYKDLNRSQYVGELEAALKLWPKTSLLLFTDLGGIVHKTGKKSDSVYFDIMTGLRGHPLPKLTAEALIGFRGQDYENYNNDFYSVVFQGSLIEEFTPHDVLRFDFLRTTNDTIYQNNVYYVSTFFGFTYNHSFTKRILATVDAYYQRDSYPSFADNQDNKRGDNLWGSGCLLSYALPKWFTVELGYKFLARDSNFSDYKYTDNRITLGLKAEY
ncbi:MAG: outer membrane beta-barrel protein [Candidatus Omnitrophica bacterium]|nr:outer membrane beta-barrel protein [Candidatus Omnitrophota bacterium]